MSFLFQVTFNADILHTRQVQGQCYFYIKTDAKFPVIILNVNKNMRKIVSEYSH